MVKFAAFLVILWFGFKAAIWARDWLRDRAALRELRRVWAPGAGLDVLPNGERLPRPNPWATIAIAVPTAAAILLLVAIWIS